MSGVLEADLATPKKQGDDCDLPGTLSTSNINSRDGTPLLTSPTALAPSNTPLQGPNSNATIPDFGVMSFSGMDGPVTTPAGAGIGSPPVDPLSPAPLAPPVNTPLVPGGASGPRGESFFAQSTFSPSQFSSPPAVTRIADAPS